MGYTHYWDTKLSGIPKTNCDAICEDAKKLLANLPAHAGASYSTDPLAIAWEDDSDKPPDISASLIRFNGKHGGRDLGHETFYLERKPKLEDYQKGDPECFAFCKTARKPYDLVVCGVLLVVAKRASEYVRISSDGEKADWLPAVEWVRSVLGSHYGLPRSILGDGFDPPLSESESAA